MFGEINEMLVVCNYRMGLSLIELKNGFELVCVIECVLV